MQLLFMPLPLGNDPGGMLQRKLVFHLLLQHRTKHSVKKKGTHLHQILRLVPKHMRSKHGVEQIDRGPAVQGCRGFPEGTDFLPPTVGDSVLFFFLKGGLELEQHKKNVRFPDRHIFRRAAYGFNIIQAQ